MGKFKHVLMAALWAVAPAAAIAGDFDGSKPLICAPVEAISCVTGEACEKGIPDEFGAPAFMRVDFAKKVIVGPRRTSPIAFMDKSENQILLQGTELGYAWTFVLNVADGKMGVTLVDRDGVFVLFGSCTPL